MRDFQPRNVLCRKLYLGVVVVLAALVVQDVLLLLWSILDVKVIFTVYIFFTDLADSLFMVPPRATPPPPSLPLPTLRCARSETAQRCAASLRAQQHHPLAI